MVALGHIAAFFRISRSNRSCRFSLRSCASRPGQVEIAGRGADAGAGSFWGALPSLWTS
jgi:hypothetical protein